MSEVEDTRIALELSEADSENSDPHQLNKRRNAIEKTRFNLHAGQQCIRDLFICLQENQLSWFDISTLFTFKTIYSSVCCSCNHLVEVEAHQTYIELPVPQNNSCLNKSIEDYFNTRDLIGKVCEGGCKMITQAEIRNQLSSLAEAEFIVVILSRVMQEPERCYLNRSNVTATEDMFIRYLYHYKQCFDQFYSFIRSVEGNDSWYEPISVVEHLGTLTTSGQSSCHYRCDVLEKKSRQWFRTNDDSNPISIGSQEVSKQGYAILFRKKMD